MKKLLILLTVAVAMATAISLVWRPVPFEERAITLRLEQVAPTVAVAVINEPIEVKAILLDYLDNEALLLKAQAALAHHPELARKILPLYGDLPEFREILLTYGDSILAPIQYFLTNDILTLRLAHNAEQKIQNARNHLLESNESKSKTPVITAQLADANTGPTPEERGWYAINYIRNEGHNFLAQFALDSTGMPKWIQTERIVKGASTFLTSGIAKLETKYQTDQPISVGDVGWAAVDSLAMLSAVKLLRFGKAATAGESINVATRTATLGRVLTRGSTWATKLAEYGKWPAMAAAAYMVIRHPGIISDALVDLAGFLDISTGLALFLGWTVILLPTLYIGLKLVRLIVRPIIGFFTGVHRFANWVDGVRKPAFTIGGRWNKHHSFDEPTQVI